MAAGGSGDGLSNGAGMMNFRRVLVDRKLVKEGRPWVVCSGVSREKKARVRSLEGIQKLRP